MEIGCWKLQPNDDGTAKEEEVTAEINSFYDLSGLFTGDCSPFHLGSMVNIVCLYFEGETIPNSRIEHILQKEWHDLIESRRPIVHVTNCWYSETINSCQNITSLIYYLFQDTNTCGCIDKKFIGFDKFSDFFHQRHANEEFQELSPYHDVENTDIAFIYLVSKEVFEDLKKAYNLPRPNSFVMRIPKLELIERSDKDKAIAKKNEIKKMYDDLCDKIETLDLNHKTVFHKLGLILDNKIETSDLYQIDSLHELLVETNRWINSYRVNKTKENTERN